MDTLADFVRLETWLLLGGLAALVAYQMLTGRINMRAMLSDNWTDGFSPGRLQLLLLTLAGAAIMVMRLGGGRIGRWRCRRSCSWPWAAAI